MRKALTILAVLALSFSLLPVLPSMALADISAGSTPVLGVGRIQATTKTTTLDTTEKLKELDSRSDSKEVSQLVKPIDREVANLKAAANPTPKASKPAAKPATTATKKQPSQTAWNTGTATAYGPVTSTAIWRVADGSRLTNTTVGVAVPIQWKSKYFGKTLEIEYKGIKVRAKVTDVGHFLVNGHSLDLQPGVFKAFGYSTASNWGVHTVRWRVVS